MAEEDYPPDWRDVFRKPAPSFEPADRPTREMPQRLSEVPEHIRKWIGDLTPEDVERLEKLQTLAKNTDLERLADLVDLAEKAATVRKFGQWAAAVVIAAFLVGASLVDAFEKLWGWLKGVPK